MKDNTFQDSESARPQDATGSPLRLVRGDASPEELAAVAAVVAILAILAILGPATGADGTDPADRSGSRWSTRRRVFHSTYPHGPGGWRASAFPH